jgi:ABC-type multidrug transport system fused ATPase/permease subunit
MDRIIVLDKGVIVEEGTHTSLLRKKGKYYKLWKMQSGGFFQEK